MTNSERLRRDHHALRQLIEALESVVIESDASPEVAIAALTTVTAQAIASYATLHGVSPEQITGELSHQLQRLQQQARH